MASEITEAFNESPDSYDHFVLALDLATQKTGGAFAICNNERELHDRMLDHYILKKLILWEMPSQVDAEDRMEDISLMIWKFLRSFVGWNAPMMDVDVVLEAPFLIESKKKDKTITHASMLLTGMCYLVRNRIRKLMKEPNNLNITIYMQNNMQWKKYFTGNGDASKDDIVKRFIDLTPCSYHEMYEKHKNQDMIDAFGILKYHVEQIRHSELKV